MIFDKDDYVLYKKDNPTPSLCSMPNSARDPLSVVRMAWWREESSVRLLTRRDRHFGTRLAVCLSLLLHGPAMGLETQLSVIYKKRKSAGDAKDDQTLQHTFVDFVVVVVAARHGVVDVGFEDVVVVVGVVVGVFVFEEVGEPVAPCAVCIWFCGLMVSLELQASSNQFAYQDRAESN